MITKKCYHCGKEFETYNPKQKFCTVICANGKNRKEKDSKNREYTHETAYLIRMWLGQGDSIEKIASALGRSIENVKLALK